MTSNKSITELNNTVDDMPVGSGYVSPSKPHIQHIFGAWTITKGKDNFINPYVRGYTIKEAWGYWDKLYNQNEIIWRK